MMYKGGSGKTTTAENLLTIWAQRRKRVLGIDLDPQHNMTTGFGYQVDELPGTINDLFADPSRDPRTVIVATEDNVHLLGGSSLIANSAMNMTFEDAYRVKDVIDQVAGDYDIVVIDTPPTKNPLTMNALQAATDVLISVAAKAYADEGLASVILSVGQAKRSNPDLQLAGIIFTQVERTLVAGRVMNTVTQDYPDYVLPIQVPRATIVDRANDMGIPLVSLEPDHLASLEYKKLARRLDHDAKD